MWTSIIDKEYKRWRTWRKLLFLDPISELEVWLNKMAKKGYRLKTINNFIYDFEKTDMIILIQHNL